MNITIKAVILFVLVFSLLLAGCSSGQLAEATVTSTPTVASTSTFTPTATATQTLPPTMTPVPTEDFSVSLERAKQIVSETILILGDYGYNETGGVCALWDEEKKDWTPLQFSEEAMSMLYQMQTISAVNERAMSMIVNKVHRYGEPGKGAKEVRDAHGKLLYYVGLSVDALSQDNSGEWRVSEVPIIIYSADGKVVSNGIFAYDNNPANPWTLSKMENELSRLNWSSSIREENRALYANPFEVDYLGANSDSLVKPIIDKGDVIAIYFLFPGSESRSVATKTIKQKFGFDPAIANINGTSEITNDGTVTNMPKNDEGVHLVYPSDVFVLLDQLNQ